MPAKTSKAQALAKKGPRKNRSRVIAPLSRCRDLVPVDSEPLRQKLWRQYKNAVKKSEKAADQLRHFKEVDAERYRAWYESMFSEEITQLRKTQSAVEDLASWMEQIQSYANLLDISMTKSFKILSQAKQEGSLNKLWEDLAKQIREEEEQQKASQCMEDDGWVDFDDMMNELFDEAVSDFHDYGGEDYNPPKTKPKVTDESTAKSLKTLFHQIALRLHPDTNPDPSHEHIQLFHAAQNAYRDGDIESLENIWRNISGNGEDIFSWKTASLSEIISRKKALDRRNHEASNELKLSRQHPAWNFSQVLEDKKSLAALKKRISNLLKDERDLLDEEWLELNELIHDLEISAKRLKKKRMKHSDI